MNSTFGFIGTGNMGGALAAAVCKTIPPERVFVSNRTKQKAVTLSETLGCYVADNTEIAQVCNFIFLGVKPQMMADLLAGLKDILASRRDSFVLVSMAAGLTVAQIAAMAGDDYPVIRIMPNTPVAVGEGMIQVTANAAVTEQQMQEFLRALSAAGKTDLLAESLIDAASAVSGCGPAYAYLFLEALADGGVACGLPRAKAMEYAAQMLLGSAKTLLESGKHPGELKDAVCSPGGTTIAGVSALENAGFRAAAMNAVKAAYDKTKAIAK